MITWTKIGIQEWMDEQKVLYALPKKQRDTIYSYFIKEANKHQDSSYDRKLFRAALPLVEGGSGTPKKTIDKWMEMK